MAQAQAREVKTRGVMDVVEFATYFGISRSKAYDLVLRGVIPSIQIGQRRRVIPCQVVDRIMTGEISIAE